MSKYSEEQISYSLHSAKTLFLHPKSLCPSTRRRNGEFGLSSARATTVIQAPPGNRTTASIR
ncbi:hypothetical protein ABS772_20020 [Methylorubrum podarium]|jgi:hypothetical protein|uniref:Transposase n=1 Tax=Methylorubrum podarium TaxID=200476 RepID=A0ABV1QS10_9HYPH